MWEKEKQSQGEQNRRVKETQHRKAELRAVESGEANERETERKKKEMERQRKAHNSAIGQKIVQLRQRQESLKMESYAKARALADQRTYRDEETARNYGRRLKEIEKQLLEIDREIAEWESKLMLTEPGNP